MPRPMPCPPPVIIATLSCSLGLFICLGSSTRRLLEVVAEADPRPPRCTVSLLIEAEGACKVEGVAQVLLVRQVIAERCQLPSLAFRPIRNPRVDQRIAVLER